MAGSGATVDDFVVEHTYLNQEKALAYLLANDHMFVNNRQYVTNPEAPKGEYDVSNETIVVFVLCSDVFAWGCADAETVTGDDVLDVEKNELYRLLTYVLDNEKWGSVKYACWKRNMQPQGPLVDKLKADGVWDDWWEALAANPDNQERKSAS